MCGRYVRRSDKQKLAEHFQAQPNPPDMLDTDYNVALATLLKLGQISNA